MSYAIPQLIHRMRQQKRASGLLSLMVWLLLTTQMAIANHGCDVNFFTRSTVVSHAMPQNALHDSMPAMHESSLYKNPAPDSQHSGHMLQSTIQQAPDPLCEKHCTPDPLQKEYASTLFAVLPTQTELLVANIANQHHHAQQYRIPIIIGPPTEIAFCRFRE